MNQYVGALQRREQEKNRQERKTREEDTENL